MTQTITNIREEDLAQRHGGHRGIFTQRRRDRKGRIEPSVREL